MEDLNPTLQSISPESVIKPASKPPSESKTKLSKWILVAITAVVLLIIAGSGYFLLQKSASKPQSTATTTTTQSTPAPDLTASWKTYSNKYYSIKFPNNWTTPTLQDDYMKFYPPQDKTPEGQVLYQFSPYISIAIYDNNPLPCKLNCSASVNSKEISIGQYKGIKYNSLEGTIGDGCGCNTEKIVIKNVDKYFVFSVSAKGNYNGLLEEISPINRDIFYKMLSALKFTNQTSQVDETANWKTYTFPNTNVSIKYPQDWTFTSGLQYSPQAIIISKQDSQSTGETRVLLEIGNIYGEGAGSASTFQHSDQFLINATNAYILTDNNLQPSIYALSSCDAPKKCLFRVPNSNYQIDFYADHFTPGNQAVEPIPTNDANISTAVKILKTVSF
jgi:hypothetical protein